MDHGHDILKHFPAFILVWGALRAEMLFAEGHFSEGFYCIGAHILLALCLQIWLAISRRFF